MDNKSLFLPLMTAITAVNAAGFLLRYFNEDPYIFLAGFRFHISFFLPFLFLFRKYHIKLIKEVFLQAAVRKKRALLLYLFLPPVLAVVILLLSGGAEISNPDHLYEFGFSSIIDYPVYLIWNMPQLFMMFLTLRVVSAVRISFIKIFSLLISFFIFEFIPVENETLSYLDIISFAAVAAISAILLFKFDNIYLFSFFVFTLLWINLLIFGSSSKEMINMLFAARYDNWEGFFSPAPGFSRYLLPLNFIITMALVLIPSDRKRKTVPGLLPVEQ